MAVAALFREALANRAVLASFFHHETFALAADWYDAAEPKRQPFIKAARRNARAAFFVGSWRRGLATIPVMDNR